MQQINWPTESGERKVVQIILDGTPYLRFQERESYHSQILKRFLDENGIHYTLRDARDGTDAPALSGERYSCPGAGWARIDVATKTVSFFGQSYGYGIPIDLEHLQALKEYAKEWHF